MSRLARWLALAAALALGTVLVVSLLAGASPYLAVGNADPGGAVAFGTPILRLLTELAAVVVVGSLSFSVLCTQPQPGGVVSAPAYRELRIAATAAAGWCGGALLLVPFTAAEVAGVPLGQVLVPDNLVRLVATLEQPRAWLLTAAAAMVLALGCRASLRQHSVAGMLGLALFALVPPLVTAHGSADSGHDLATAALVVHVPVAAVWLGTLLVVLRSMTHGGHEVANLLTRYDRLAIWCWLVLLVSGFVLGIVLAGPVTSGGYGLLLLVKLVLAVLLGLGGLLVRRKVVRGFVAAAPRGRQIVRVALAELTVLVVLFGVSVGLTHLPLPDVFGRAVETAEVLLGYPLEGTPTLFALLTDWRLELIFGPLAALLAIGYLLGVRRLRTDGQRWPAGRTAAWLAGCLVLLVATSSGIGRYGAAMFSMHQVSHMLTSMLAPALLVLGAPLTLIGAASGQRSVMPSGAEMVSWLSRSRLVGVLTHPVMSLLLFAGSPFALYFTGLFDVLVRFHWGHMLITAWFLAVGYLFFWPVIGVDRAPRQLPNLARLGVLLAAMPADIVFGALLIGTDRVIGNGPAASMMYQALALPWVPDLHADQALGGILALVLGELALFVALAALLGRWARVDDEDVESGLGAYRSLVREVRSR